MIYALAIIIAVLALLVLVPVAIFYFVGKPGPR